MKIIKLLFLFITLALLSLTHEELTFTLDMTSMFINVIVGNPPQRMKMMVDLSSPVNLLFSHDCQACKLPLYITNSTSLVQYKYGSNYSMTTYEGTFSGEIATESFTFIGRYVNVQLDLNFLLVTSTDSNTTVDGVIGLGYMNGKANKKLLGMSMIEALLAKNVINSRKFYFDYEHSVLVFGKCGELPNIKHSEVDLIKSDRDVPSFYANMTGVVIDNSSHEFKNSWIVKDIRGLATFSLYSRELFHGIYAPKNATAELMNNYFQYFALKQNATMVQDEEFYYTDVVYLTQPPFENETATAFIFDTLVFSYKWARAFSSVLHSAIRISNLIDYWHIGLNMFNPQRISFDIDNMKLTLYDCNMCGLTIQDIENHSTIWLVIFLLITTLLCIIIIICFICRRYSQYRRNRAAAYLLL